MACSASRRRRARAWTELLEAIVGTGAAAARATSTRAPRALIFDSEFDQYRGVVAYVRVVDGTLRKDDAIVAMQTGTHAEIDEIGFFGPQMTPVDALHAGEVGYVITGIKDVSQLRVGDTLTTRSNAAARAAAGLPRDQADGLLRAVPGGDEPVPRAARRAREARAERRGAHLGAGDERGARVRVPLRLPRPAAHGHRARASRARVRPRAAGHHANGRVRRDAHGRQRGGGALAVGHAGPRGDRRDQGALHPRHDPHAEGARGRRDGALPGAPRHARGHDVPVPGARAAPLRPAAGGDRARLLRPAEVAHARAMRRSTTS